MFPYSTVIFDLDGTLLDTLQDLCDSANYALSLHQMPTRSLDEIRRFVGNGVGLLIHRAVPAGTPEEVEAQCLADFRAHYLLNMENRTAPYTGVLELLDGLWHCGVETYPLFLEIPDKRAPNLSAQYKLWNKKYVLGKVVDYGRNGN